MGGIRPDFDPVAALAKARARLDAAKRATAGAVFAGPDFSVPALDGADLGTPAMVGLPARDVTGLRAPDLVRPPSGGGVSFAHPEQTTAEDVRRRRITAALHTDLPGGDETINAVRAVPGATMGMLGTVTGLVAPETTKSLVAQAQSVAGEPGVGTTLGGLATGLYTAGALGNVTAALVPKIGAALSSPTFGARWAANVGTFAPIDIASGLQEGRETGHPVQAIGRNLAMNAAGAALFEGGAQAFRSTMPRTVNAQQAADIANAPPPRVQRPPSQLVHPERPIFENPDPMAEAAVARAGQPIPTNKDGVPLDVLEAQAVPLPPEAYAGPERRMRIESISADDILNQHRRAADLPPTTAPLVPRVQSGTPRTGTVGGMQSVTRADFTRPPVADEAAVLERLAMQERSAASELAARELGTPPRMEGVAPILPMPGTKGRTKLVGGDEKFRYTDDTALQDEYDAVLERLDANNKTFNAGTTMWTRDDPNLGGVQRSGTSISGEAGRAKGGVSRDATYLGRIEEELNRRGIDPVDARERAYAARAARAKAAAAENLPASLRESQGPDRFNSGKVTGALKTGEPVTLDIEHSDMNGAQWDALLIARDAEGRPLGGIDFSEYEGKPSIKMIEVKPAARRKGVATALYRELERRYPGVRIDRGMSTPEGTSFLKSILPDLSSERGALGIPGGPGFKSRLVEAVKSTKWDKAPARTWISKLRGQQSSADEFDWALGDALRADPNKQWTRAEVLALAEQRGYGALTETVHRSDSPKAEVSFKRITEHDGTPTAQRRWNVEEHGTGRLLGELTETPNGRIAYQFGANGEQRRLYDNFAEAQGDIRGMGHPQTKFASYVEPGGTNYREVLLRVPTSQDIPDPRFRGDPRPEFTAMRQGAFTSSHWDEPNVLAHIRMNDRVGPNGEKILHVEEFQSDWHQKGRKEGYDGHRVAYEIRRGDEVLGSYSGRDDAERWMESVRANSPASVRGLTIHETLSKATGVPDAPFKETPEWLGLSMKRVLDEAVAGGYDAVSWTPGIKQADRYSLRKVADEVRYNPSTNELLVLKGGAVIHNGTYDPKALPDVIGKEAADRLLATRAETITDSYHVRQSETGDWDVFGPNGRLFDGGYPSEVTAERMAQKYRLESGHTSSARGHVLTGEQLEIGGEGMQAFYDQMLPDWVRGYAKKLGVRLDIEQAPILKGDAGKSRLDMELFDESIHDIATGYGGRERVTESQGRLVDALQAFGERHADEPRSPADFNALWFATAKEHGVGSRARAEGWDVIQSNLKTEDPAGLTPTFKITPELRAAIGKGQNYGKGAVPVMGGLTGAGVGGAVGYATGDTPEERRRNALLGALAGASIGGGIGYASERIGIRYAPQIRDWASRTYQGLLNDVHAADEFGRRVGRTEAVAQATATARGWQGRADWYIGKRGPAVGGPLTLKQVMLSAKGIEPEVQALATYRHALELDAAGMADKGVDLTLARQNIPLLEADPRVKAAADELHAFYRRLLDDRLANGLLDQAQYDAIVARGDYYVPFVREWSVEQRPGTTGGGRLFNRSSGVRRMNPQEVASSAIVNPFKQAVLDAQSTARDIGRQRVMNTVGDILTAHPNEAAPYLVDHGPMATTPPLHASLQDRVITPVINGVKHRVEVTDPDLLASLQAQAPASESIFKKLLTVPKRLLQGGVTMHPEFGAANASRDAFFSSMQYHFPTASALTGTALGAGVGAATAEPGQRLEGAAIGAGLGLGAGVMAPHLLRTVQGLSHVLKYDDLYQQWLQAGGSGMGMYVKTPADAQRLVRRLTTQHGPLDILNPKSWWDGLQFVNEAIEQAPRVARFADELGKGASPTAAAASSRDISVDFSRRGGDPGVRAAADVTAFWNPNIQGLDKVRRTLFSKNSAKAWAMGAATMTAPSLALFAINKDDPAYWDRPLWERNLFWLVPAGQLENGETRFIRVPKPFEPGYIFASIPERLAEFAYQRDPERTSAALRDMVGNTLGAFVPVPTAIKPVAEAVVNYDTFRRRPVVPQGLENLPASRQVLPQTSVAARAAGAIGEAVGVPISPLKTDHVIRGLTGPLGAGALEAVADPVARLVGLDRGPQPPARPLVEWSRFVTKSNGFGTDDVQTMFRRFDRAEQWHTDITRRATAGDPTVGDVVRAHREDLLLYTQLKPFVSAFRDLSAARRAVTASRTMNPDEKRAALLQLGEYAAELATKAVNGMSGQVPRRVPPPGTDQPTTIPLGGR